MLVILVVTNNNFPSPREESAYRRSDTNRNSSHSQGLPPLRQHDPAVRGSLGTHKHRVRQLASDTRGYQLRSRPYLHSAALFAL